MVDLTSSHGEDMAGGGWEGGYDPAFVVGGEGGRCIVWHVNGGTEAIRDGG